MPPDEEKTDYEKFKAKYGNRPKDSIYALACLEEREKIGELAVEIYDEEAHGLQGYWLSTEQVAAAWRVARRSEVMKDTLEKKIKELEQRIENLERELDRRPLSKAYPYRLVKGKIVDVEVIHG